MISNELQNVTNSIIKATKPEEIFGKLDTSDMPTQLKQLVHIYFRIMHTIHPDKYTTIEDKALATEVTKKLSSLYNEAEVKIKSNSYNKTNVIKFNIKNRTYTFGKLIYSGETAKIFKGVLIADDKEVPIIIKISNSILHNELLNNEAKILTIINKEEVSKIYPAYPTLFDTITIDDATTHTKRQVNILSDYQNVSLKDVIQKFPDGIDPRDAAWMFNRMLESISLLHGIGIVHNYLAPSHVMLDLPNHNAILIDWTRAKIISEPVETKQASSKHAPYLFTKTLINRQALDIYSAGKIMIKLLGGDIETNAVPNSIPKSVRNLLAATILQPPTFDSAAEIREEFVKILKALYGKPVFRPFML